LQETIKDACNTLEFWTLPYVHLHAGRTTIWRLWLLYYCVTQLSL